MVILHRETSSFPVMKSESVDNSGKYGSKGISSESQFSPAHVESTRAGQTQIHSKTQSAGGSEACGQKMIPASAS